MIYCLFLCLSQITTHEENEYAGIKIEDLKVVATLGVGGFGRVELVSISSNGYYPIILKFFRNGSHFQMLKKFMIFFR